jgi:hypothetical protein
MNIPTYKKILYLGPNSDKRPDEQTMTRPDDYDVTLPQSIEKGIVKVVSFQNEIRSWISACMNSVPEKSDMYYYLKQYYDYWSI